MRFSLLGLLASSFALARAQTSDSAPLQPTPTTPPVGAFENQHLLQARQATTSGSSSATSATISIPGNAAAGGLSYTAPAITDAISYYKIAPSNQITFGWNYTSLYVTPSMLTFEARCSANSFTYPVGPTTGIPGSSTQLVWDPYEYAQSDGAIPFAQASYTLRVYDERGIGAIATAGYFNGANSIVNFALYSPAAYTPLSQGWTCVTCSFAAVSKHINTQLLVALPVTLALVLIGGAGVFHR